jgi:sulfur carrier protein
MIVVVNGTPHDVPPATTVADMLGRLQVAGRPVAVEVNLRLVPRERHGEHTLEDGDRLEIVTLVGGG